MNDKELIARLIELAEWADANEWEVPIDLGDTIMEAAERLKQVQWVSAKESHPAMEDSEWVIGVANGKRHIDAIVMVGYDKEEDEWYLDASPNETVSVSYWMPLPEPPEMEAQP